MYRNFQSNSIKSMNILKLNQIFVLCSCGFQKVSKNLRKGVFCLVVHNFFSDLTLLNSQSLLVLAHLNITCLQLCSFYIR